MSTIAAGTTTGTALVNTGDTTGNLVLQTNGTTTALTLNTSQAMGVGSSPSYGTSGQVLTSGGSAAAPTWTTPSAGAMTLISTQTASASSSLAWTGLSGYNAYYLLINNLYGSASGNTAAVQLGYGATPTYVTSNYFLTEVYGNASTPSGGSQVTSPYFYSTSPWGASAAYPLSAAITITNTNIATASRTLMLGVFVGGTGATTATNYSSCLGGSAAMPSAVTAIKVAATGGTFTGTVSLYGISS